MPANIELYNSGKDEWVKAGGVGSGDRGRIGPMADGKTYIIEPDFRGEQTVISRTKESGVDPRLIGRGDLEVVKELKNRKSYKLPTGIINLVRIAHRRKSGRPKQYLNLSPSDLNPGALTIGDFPEQITIYRARLGISQRELAQIAGLNSSTISRLEGAQREPTASTASALISALGLNLQQGAELLKAAQQHSKKKQAGNN